MSTPADFGELSRAARRASERRALAAGLFLIAAAQAARGDLLPNELPGDSGLRVTVRGEAGRYYRPGLPVMLNIAIENSGEPWRANVSISETRVGGSAVFGGEDVVTLAKGSNSFSILAALGGLTAHATLGITRCRTEGDVSKGRLVYRGDLTRVLRPLGPNERLLLAAGVEAFPLPEGFVHCVLDPRTLPSTPHAYAAADVVVIERIRRDDVNPRQAEALVSWLRSGGRVVLASFRAMAPFERQIFGSDPPPRTPADLREHMPGSQEHRVEGLPPEVSFPFGLGRMLVFAAEPGDASKWADKGASARFLRASERASADVWIDARAFRRLAPDHPFESAADRAKTVALIGALLASVVVALLATKKRPVAAVTMTGAQLVWAAIAAFAFKEPEGAIRVLRVRALTADGHAEVVTDTAVFTAFRKDSTLCFKTPTGPVLPVAHRQGDRLASPFWLGRMGNAWRLRGLPVGRDMLAVARATSARAVDADSDSLRLRVLARGRRAGVETLPGGEVRLAFRGEEPASDIRYLLDTLVGIGYAMPRLRRCHNLKRAYPVGRADGGARERRSPPAKDKWPPVVQSRGELAWLWIEGEPDGVHALSEGRLDPAPGSGTLVVAAAPLKLAAEVARAAFW